MSRPFLGHRTNESTKDGQTPTGEHTHGRTNRNEPQNEQAESIRTQGRRTDRNRRTNTEAEKKATERRKQKDEEEHRPNTSEA